MNWDKCEFVERVEGRCGGRPTLVGTRVWPEIFVEHADEYGMSVEEMHDHFPSASVEQIRGVLAFAASSRANK